MKRVPLVVVALGVVMLASATQADQITMFASKPTEGTFKGVAKGSMIVLNEKGKVTRELPSRISRITFSAPIPVTYLTSDSKKEETALLTAFEKQEYHLEKDGKPLRVAASKIKTMDLTSENDGGGGAGGVENAYPVPACDSAVLQAAVPNPTEPQQKALARFQKAKQSFDAFLAESTTLVEKMDKAAGAKRQELLNTLRERKNKEQPIKAELVAAYSALKQLYPPDALAAPFREDGPEAHPERDKIKKAVMEW
jgi:hypothetical protein